MENMKGQYSSSKRRRHWTHEEDLLLKKCVEKYGQGNWHLIPARAGIKRCRKSCRLRWLNYLCPNIKRGDFTEDEDDLIFKLHKLLGNRWSLIAGRIPGRTANDVKNHWNCHLRKRLDASDKTNKKPIHERVQVIKPQPRILPKDIKICPNKHNPEIEVTTVMTPPRVISKPVWSWENLLSNEEEETNVASGDMDEVKLQSSGNIPWFDGLELLSQAEAALMAEGYECEALASDKDLCYGDWFDLL